MFFLNKKTMETKAEIKKNRKEKKIQLNHRRDNATGGKRKKKEFHLTMSLYAE